MRALRQFAQSRRTSHIHRIASMILFGIIMLTNLSVAIASAKDVKPTHTAINDVRVLIDISGSMKLNDPANLRQPALQLFVSLLPEKMKSGIWTFGQWVNMLVPHGLVTKQWKNNAKKSVNKINSAGLFTNIEDAIRQSTWDWRSSDSIPGSKRSLILLTDGLVDISKDDETNQISRNNILQELLPVLQKADITIHAIALSNESDKNLLKQLTAATGGKFETIETTKDLERLFLHLFENVVPTDNLPLAENKVKVDDSIKEMTFLIFRENAGIEGSITSPSGNKYTIENQLPEMTWHHESHYDLITVKNPETGYWKINTKVDPDNRVTVVTDLKLLTSKIPDILYEGDEQDLYIKLENNGVIIDQQDFLHFVKVKYSQKGFDKDKSENKWTSKIYDDGKGIDKKAKDGIYSIRLNKSLITGEHDIKVNVNGTTFKRQYAKHVVVHDEPATANIELTPNGSLRVSVMPYQTLINADSMEVIATHNLPNGKKNNSRIDNISPAEWAHDFPSEGVNGNHNVLITITGINNNGKPINVTLNPLSLDVEKPAIPSEAQEKVIEKIIEHENPPPDNKEIISWGLVSLKIGIFNLIFLALLFILYKYTPKIRRIITPTLFEEASDG